MHKVILTEDQLSHCRSDDFPANQSQRDVVNYALGGIGETNFRIDGRRLCGSFRDFPAPS
jgi:hypothetical protein